MSRHFLWVVIGAPLALTVIGSATALFVPTMRHIVSGLWNLPDHLPALPQNHQVHYEQGAEALARDVAAMLPDAITRIEAVHGRRFAHAVTVGVYATLGAYAAANGQGSDVPVGVTFVGRVNLSPKLLSPQHGRLQAILAHELSHAHVQGWLGETRYIRLPNWFKEGLAVMASGGGGAELVSEDEARAAIQRGEQIAIDESGSFQNLVGVRYDGATAKITPSWYPVVLAYRQAGMFVTYLRKSDARAFDHMMSAILDGRPFPEAVALGYHDGVRSLWQKFAKSISEPR